MKALSEREYSIIKYGLGMSYKKTIPEKYYKNILRSGKNQEDYRLLCDMRDKGLLTKGRELGSGYTWYVTLVGMQLFEDQFKMHISESNSSALIKKYHKRSTYIGSAALLFWIIQTIVFLGIYGWHWKAIGLERYLDGIVLILLVTSLWYYIKTLGVIIDDYKNLS